METSLLFTSVIYCLAAIGAAVVLLSIAVGVAYLIAARRLARSLRKTVESMERSLLFQLAASRSSSRPCGRVSIAVPPMRIHVESTSPWLRRMSDPLTEKIDSWLREHSFETIGDFIIEELGREQLRLFLSEDRCLIAAIRHSADDMEPYVEFCIDLGESGRGGVSNPPRGTLQLPSDAIGSYHTGKLSENFQLLSRMWLEVKELIDEHDVVPFHPERVPEFFEDAHTCEMEFRIAQGGVSEEEIRAAFVAQGLLPTDADVMEIQEQWQVAIERHLLDFSARAQNHHYAGGRILIVHNGTVRSYIVNRMLEMFDRVHGVEGLSREELVSTVSELQLLLNRFSPREAVARFRPLLPPPIRYNLVDQLDQPVKADLYLLQPE